MNYILETTSIINNVNETKRVQHRPGPCYRFSCVNRSRTHSVTERLPTIRSLNSFSHSLLDMRLCYTLIGALVVAQLLAVDSATFLPCMVVLDNDTRQIIGRTGTVDHEQQLHNMCWFSHADNWQLRKEQSKGWLNDRKNWHFYFSSFLYFLFVVCVYTRIN